MFSAHFRLIPTGNSWTCITSDQPHNGNDPGCWASMPPVPLKSKRRSLRVVIYARYSTEEQDVSSIDDQVEYCKMCLHEMDLDDAEITVLLDKETSGELRNRPGIDPIWVGVKEPRWDLLICEDGSRLFRNKTACLELIEEAVDNGMRVIFINDNVDTTEDGWHAARHITTSTVDAIDAR
jgi:Resolvase, N terminal domain